MADEVISANAMALAARFDPQFAVPRRPRVRRGLSLRRFEDRLVVEGTPTRHVLRGKAATELVPGIVPLLDGTRDHVAVAEALGTDPAAVFAALSLLWTCGVIEDEAPSDVDTDWVPEHLADYLSRAGDSTEANAAWELAAQRLAHTKVALHGPAPVVELLRAELAPSLPLWAAPGERPDLVLLAGDDPDLAGWCWQEGIALLRVRLDDTTAEAGPYVHPAIGPCLDCLTAPYPQASGTLDNQANLLVGASLIAGQVVALVSRATPTVLPTRWTRTDLAKLAGAQRCAATRPGCPRCSIVDGPVREASLASHFDASVALPPRAFADPKAHQVHYKPANVALQRKHKTWPLSPRIDLPASEVAQLNQPLSDVDTYALLLKLVAGWRGVEPSATGGPEKVSRWTATGGNIGSVVAYLAVREVDGWAPGVYGYLPSTHQLALVNPDAGAIPGDSPATIVLGADLGRVAYKYGPFALRIVLLDSGCAQTTLLAAARELGLPARIAPRWDDPAVSAALLIDPDAEPITGIVHCGGTA